MINTSLLSTDKHFFTRIIKKKELKTTFSFSFKDEIVGDAEDSTHTTGHFS